VVDEEIAATGQRVALLPRLGAQDVSVEQVQVGPRLRARTLHGAATGRRRSACIQFPLSFSRKSRAKTTTAATPAKADAGLPGAGPHVSNRCPAGRGPPPASISQM
jgi:hypothetical protein